MVLLVLQVLLETQDLKALKATNQALQDHQDPVGCQDRQALKVSQETKDLWGVKDLQAFKDPLDHQAHLDL